MSSQIREATGFPGGIRLGENADSLISKPSGRAATQVLDVAADVASGETVVIGGDTYRVAVINTEASQVVENGELNNTSRLVTLTMVGHGLIGGDVLRVENEMMEVISVLNANQVQLRRGISGTTIATHADETAIYTEATKGAGSIAVGLVTTLTPTVFTTALVADINNRGRLPITAYRHDANTVLVYTSERAGGTPIASTSALATTETLAGSGNAWRGATLTNGRGNEAWQFVKIVPSSAEATAGEIFVVFPFTPVVEAVFIFATATGTMLAWDGDATVSGGLVTLDNSGSADWDANDTIFLFVRGQ